MKARQLIDGASYGPDASKVIVKAFDKAWVMIAGNYDSASVEAARLKLANAVLSVAREDSRDVEALK
jgi:hypothetical protein